MTQITWIRHGNTQWNVEKRAQGHTNNPLNEAGFAQARAVAARLAGEVWDVMYASDLLRAKQTAEHIAEAAGIPVIHYDVRLREVHGGLIEGTTEEERLQRWGSDWRSRTDLNTETPEESAKRGGAFVAELEERHPGGRILIVSHGAIIRRTLHGLIPDIATDRPLSNTSVTVISKAGDRWQYDLYDSTTHLD
ncbi:histidine phosphatase family protein [Paenibacillus filicis]|uniref:Histidine phosphatase family protein n=1 Tax=Paenibacillus filicis TaxID=669464 RepID=A0ABU9DPU4_9BACL